MRAEGELIRGIEEQTQREIEKIRGELARLETDRKSRADAEIESLKKKIDDHTSAQLRKAEKAAQALISTECHKIELEARERFFEQIVRTATNRIRELIESKGYDAILKGWIVEAAVGLAADEAQVSASAPELEMCRRVLPEAEKEVGRVVGHPVTLRLSESPAAADQGVILTALSGRTAYNNQVHTRMMRQETAVGRIIYDELSRAGTQGAPDGEQAEKNGEHDG